MKRVYLLSVLLSTMLISAPHTMVLDKDHIITQPLSHNGEKLIIRSDSNKNLVVRQGTTWDLRKEAGEIEVAGNACLVIEQGAKIIGHGGIVRFKDDAHCIVKKEKV